MVSLVCPSVCFDADKWPKIEYGKRAQEIVLVDRETKSDNTGGTTK